MIKEEKQLLAYMVFLFTLGTGCLVLAAYGLGWKW
jgi:hypothetical protein